MLNDDGVELKCGALKKLKIGSAPWTTAKWEWDKERNQHWKGFFSTYVMTLMALKMKSYERQSS